ASLSVLLSEMIQISNLDLLKLRGGVAMAGNDTEPYQLVNILSTLESWDGIVRLGKNAQLLSRNLMPEEATSYETGIDVAFLGNRVRFSGTYYVEDNKNQIFPSRLAPSSGFTSQKINNGLLRSKGVELVVGGT